jgi:riboflavin kinase/FMN adenylyltransferase
MERVRLDSLAGRGWPSPAVTIGNFDGVHRGHQALTAAAIRWARAHGGRAVVLTLDPHPARVLAPGHAPPLLTTLDQKAELLEAVGIDMLAVVPFTPGLQQLEAEDFARRVLAGALGARMVIVGDGFRFGHDRRGDVPALGRLGAELGFEVEGVAPVLHGGRPISSSRVREALVQGQVEEAQALLGRAYFMDGVVVEGERRGRTLGFPTANLDSENEVVPGAGVYVARCRRAGGPWSGAVVNVGRRPTFGGRDVSVEAHLLGFEGDLYGSRLRIEFHRRLRGEQRFEGPDALVTQIRTDVARAQAFLAESPAEGRIVGGARGEDER